MGTSAGWLDPAVLLEGLTEAASATELHRESAESRSEELRVIERCLVTTELNAFLSPPACGPEIPP